MPKFYLVCLCCVGVVLVLVLVLVLVVLVLCWCCVCVVFVLCCIGVVLCCVVLVCILHNRTLMNSQTNRHNLEPKLIGSSRPIENPQNPPLNLHLVCHTHDDVGM